MAEPQKVVDNLKNVIAEQAVQIAILAAELDDALALVKGYRDEEMSRVTTNTSSE
jgi:hypothetical protein